MVTSVMIVGRRVEPCPDEATLSSTVPVPVPVPRDLAMSAVVDMPVDQCFTPMRVGRTGRVLRRVVDISVASVALVLLAIPMGFIALVIAANSRGGALFVQTRVGRRGDPIRVLKFRSMVDGAHDSLIADDELRAAYVANDFKLDGDHDPRITNVGRLLRKTSLDELPQLWNVIRGDMSVVGNRPLLFEELALRPEYDQELYKLLQPGMTGLWQVRGRSNLDAVERIALDREYVENWSPWNDAKIICLTPLAVFRIHHTH
jgi:lipopolysaccharide/colanic/teichoic acid biosynthesis glycosyltransferase